MTRCSIVNIEHTLKFPRIEHMLEFVFNGRIVHLAR